MSEPKLRVISLGAGVQSSAMLLKFGAGADCAIFADTGWEPRKVYDHLAWLETVSPIPIHRVSAGNIRDGILARRNTTGGRFTAIPWFTINPDGSRGMGRRQCTSEYKLKPIMHKLRDLLGVDRRARIPRGAVEVWVGISTDEASRMKQPRQQWQRNAYPLIDAGMSRDDCDEWLWVSHGRRAPKSSCIGCPFHSDDMWRSMWDSEPEEWADAITVDRALREGDARGFRGVEFMHAQRVPLDEVDLALAAPDTRQLDMFINECEGMCGV